MQLKRKKNFFDFLTTWLWTKNDQISFWLYLLVGKRFFDKIFFHSTPNFTNYNYSIGHTGWSIKKVFFLLAYVFQGSSKSNSIFFQDNAFTLNFFFQQKFPTNSQDLTKKSIFFKFCSFFWPMWYEIFPLKQLFLRVLWLPDRFRGWGIRICSNFWKKNFPLWASLKNYDFR